MREAGISTACSASLQLISHERRFQLRAARIPNPTLSSLPYTASGDMFICLEGCSYLFCFTEIKLQTCEGSANNAISKICHLWPHPRLPSEQPPFLLHPQIFVPKEMRRWWLWAFYLTFQPPREVFQTQLNASKIFITQIIFCLSYHLNLNYTTYSLTITMSS